MHDSGVGVTPDAKDLLFQKFQQADGSVTRRFGGTGLGLSICRELVELMGGRIAIADNANGGSTFWFEIDFELGAPVIPTSVAHCTLHDVRILVVDDLEINRLIFAEQLSAEGAVVTPAASGREALSMLNAAERDGQTFDLVLLDHMMPGMAGDDVAAYIRSDPTHKPPCLVFASSLGILADNDRKNLFDAFLTKPVRHAELVHCLGRVLGRTLYVQVPAEATTMEKAPHGVGRILLADDHEINRFLATTLLESAGYEVEAVTNGLEAANLVEKSRFDLILMDVHMPLMDGLEASRAVRALGDAVSQPRIVALTANALMSDREECMRAGMDDFIGKPFDPEQFLVTVAHNMAAME